VAAKAKAAVSLLIRFSRLNLRGCALAWEWFVLRVLRAGEGELLIGCVVRGRALVIWNAVLKGKGEPEGRAGEISIE
jgi:hypothetical protein